MAEIRGLTKDSLTIAEHRLATVDGLHKLYVQEWGNPKGVPIVFLHGGPGSGCDDKHKNYFDAKRHRVIFIDQRGAGNSQPYGSLKNNKTEYLVEDIELVRQKLGIKSWHVEGASWGSTLALCYAIAHPEAVKSLVILGIFLASTEEVEWITKGVYKNFYPEIHAQAKTEDLHYDREDDQRAYLETFIPLLGIDDRPKPLPTEVDTTPAKIELYYMHHKFFLTDNHILDNAAKITCPVTIIQGRYDMVTPPINAYKLSKRLPDGRLHTTLTGHLPSDREAASVLKAVLSQLS